MKRLTLVLFSVLYALTGMAQTWYLVNPGDVPLVDIDAFDGAIAATISPLNEPHLFSVNTTDSSNAWVFGTTSKSYFDNETGWVTDSINAYADSLRSELVVMIPSNTGWEYQSVWIVFEHKYATDTLTEGGYLEYSCDSLNWELVGQSWSQGDPPQQLDVLNFPSMIHDTIAGFTGGEADWEWSAVQFIWWYSVFQGNETRSSGCEWENMDTVYVRFVFESDSIQTNKDGWMIRNMIIGLDNFPGAIADHVKSPIEVYPNPASDRILFRVPEGIETPTTVSVFDMMGKTVLSTSYRSSMDVTMLNTGNYIVAFVTDTNVFRQKLVVK